MPVALQLDTQWAGPSHAVPDVIEHGRGADVLETGVQVPPPHVGLVVVAVNVPMQSRGGPSTHAEFTVEDPPHEVPSEL